MRYALSLTIVLALAFAVAACEGGSSTTAALLPNGDGGVYLALGDSIADGEGASDREATDYVAQVYEALQSRYGASLQLESLAVGGHTTQDLIDQQLGPAVALIEGGDVRAVTITIAGNDLYVLANDPVCPTEPASPDCPFEDIIAETEKRLNAVLRELRAAGPDTPIVIEVYPNLFSGTGNAFEEPAEYSFGRLNEVIEAVADDHDVLIADPRDGFEGRATEVTAPNFHPNDPGYEIIAAAFLEVLGLQ